MPVGVSGSIQRHNKKPKIGEQPSLDSRNNR